MGEEFRTRGQHEVAKMAGPLDMLVIANQLRPILLRLNRFLRNEAHDLGVTSIQASLLGTILRNEHIGLGELAEQEHISAPTMVKHIDKLEGAGLAIRKRNCTRDRRRIELQITEEGKKKVQELRARRTAWLAAHLEMLEPEEQIAIASAIEPLQKLAIAVSSDRSKDR
jgi:Transcriptional regulators